MSTNRLDLQRFRDRDDPGEQAWLLLETSRIAARQGNLDEARRLLRASVRADPRCAEAWLGLAWLARDRPQREAFLRRVLELEPGHAQASAELARLQGPHQPKGSAGRASAKAALPETRSAGGGAASGARSPHLRRWLLVLAAVAAGMLLLAILALGPVDASLAWLVPTPLPTPIPTPTLTPGEIAAKFQPQLEAAQAGDNWDRALEIVAIMQGVDPSGEQVRHWAAATHLQYGQFLVQTGRAAKAQAEFDQAVALAPEQAEARLWQETTQIYLTAEVALKAGQWDAAIESYTLAQQRIPDYDSLAGRLLEAYRLKGQAALKDGQLTVAIEALAYVYDEAPNTPGVAGLLADAYRQRGIARQEEDNLPEAKSDLEAALALRPDDAEAQAHLDEVMYVLFPPKRIEIDISKQRFYAYEGDTLVYTFLTSTGLPGRDTAAGHFKVLDKIPMAYSSVWRLQMPYWLGIYYVGTIENGIHALPIRPDGSVMWGGLLGQRASYGCIILSTEAAQTIYDWAEIGTEVDIHY
jgi:tetratricopeptide (TPR) repeat protein